jgi:iron-sulfur cluster repair protein YtfE (RIC family)
MTREDTESRSYVNHLLSEHRRLHHLLRDARRALAVSGVRKSPAECVEVLGRVRDELRSHFADEEEGGCLAEAVSRCPSLSAETRAIEAQHPALLMRLDTLIDRISRCDASTECRIETVRDFDDLLRELRSHEAAENNILRRGFGTNVVDDDEAEITLLNEQ